MRASGQNVSGEPFSVNLAKLGFAVSSASATGRAALRAWLATQPKLDDVAMLAHTSRIGRQAISEVGQWSETLTAGERTDLLLDLAEDSALTGTWITEVGAHALDENRLVRYVADKVRQEPRAQDRATWIKLIVAVRPDDSAAQREVADLMLSLLARDTDVDFKNAEALSPALGQGHRRKGALQAAWRTATANRKVTAKAARDLERAGVNLPKRSLKQKLLGRLTPPSRD